MVAARDTGLRQIADALVESLLDTKAAKQFAKIVAMELRGEDPGWVPQSNSVLGPRVHCRAVRRRIAENKPGAKMRGTKVFLLSQEAIAEELGNLTDRARRPKRLPSDGKPAEPDPVEELHDALARVRGKR